MVSNKDGQKIKVMFVLCLSMVSGPAWAQTILPTGCESITWDANAETDLAGYNLYITQDGVALTPPVEMASIQTAKPCADIPQLVDGHTYALELTAFDTSGNESVPSASVTFEWPDSTPPATPSGTCVQFTDGAGDLQCVMAP